MHTVRIKNKPTPEGYKILSLCDAGYTYAFIFTSRIQSCPEVKQIPNLNKVRNEIYHLASQLPLNKTFNIYMDNFSLSINLYQYLCDNNFGACGTVQTNSAKFPKILKVNKKLDWDTLSGVIVVHKIIRNENRIERIRRRPRETSTNVAKVQAIFETASIMVFNCQLEEPGCLCFIGCWTLRSSISI
ncbi:19077_t:CDS:2 [Dentiscutata erythropus]|uniref:19077_t:CDS:1 n=1 Tax=Dentiscutata erythropus TaxID=1348616 RepID=A0A9N9DY82_9GLOM|nr:19077_t:CDS:2 [Dentiscutata erythropus]